MIIQMDDGKAGKHYAIKKIESLVLKKKRQVVYPRGLTAKMVCCYVPYIVKISDIFTTRSRYLLHNKHKNMRYVSSLRLFHFRRLNFQSSMGRNLTSVIFG